MILNKEQRKASEFSTGPSLVIAGAGTGKTKTLVRKVGSILASGEIKDYEILLLTFSRKAAREMTGRLTAELGTAHNVRASTFHSFCYHILMSNEPEFLALSGYKKLPEILAAERKHEIVRNIADYLQFEYGGLPIQVLVSCIDDSSLVESIRDKEIKNEVTILVNEYRKFKTSSSIIEFEEIIDYAVKLLKKNMDLRKKYSERYKYLLVDEFQDTSDNNFEFLRCILNAEKNFFAVGDDYQLIYSFRNSRIKYILHLRKYFPRLRIYKLRINYRSRREIVKISGRFILKNRIQSRKKLKSAKGAGGVVSRIPYDGYENGADILGKVCDRIYLTGSTAVLFRNNFIEKHLISVVEKFPGISFMTMHSSKGLEFDNVIIFGIDDSIIPSPWCHIEEERRLFYVAMTRAKERLVFMYSNSDLKMPLFMRELDE